MHGSGAIALRDRGRMSAIGCLKVYAPPHASSLRTQGPITTGVSRCAKVVERRLSKQATRRMGPRFRGDDGEFTLPCS